MYRKIIIETFDNIFKNAKYLVPKLIIPTFLISLITYFVPQFITIEAVENIDLKTLDPVLLQISIVSSIILIMANISIAVTTHRVSILGEKSVPTFGSLIFGFREFKFLFRSILFGFFIGIITFLIMLIPIAGIFLVPIVLIILTSRLSLIFPAVSCDEKMSFFQSWKYTKDFKLLTILMVIIFPIIFSLTVGIVYTFAIEFLIKLVSPHMAFLYSILNVFIMVFTISGLSSVYNHIRPRVVNNAIKKEEEPLREIIQSSRKGVHKIILDDRYDIDFQTLKKELKEQFTKLGFDQTAYERPNAWLVKTLNDDEAYISLRYDDNNYTIQAKNTEEPKLKILK